MHAASARLHASLGCLTDHHWQGCSGKWHGLAWQLQQQLATWLLMMVQWLLWLLLLLVAQVLAWLLMVAVLLLPDSEVGSEASVLVYAQAVCCQLHLNHER